MTPSVAGALSDAGEALIGRGDELGTLLGLLLDPATPVVSLVGQPGIGKTALGLNAAGQLLADGARVGLAMLDADERDSVRGTLRPVPAADDPVAAVAAALAACGEGGGRAVVCVDLGPLVVDRATAERMVTAAAGASLFVISLRPLHLRGERSMLLGPLTLPVPGGDPHGPAVDLLLRSAQVVRPDLQLTTATAPALASIARVCAGIPLALELAGRRLRSLTPQDLLLRLRAPLTVLASGGADVTPRHRSMSAAIATTWNPLQPAARELAGRIAMLAGALTLEQVEEICLDDADSIDLIAAADELIDAGLLQPVSGDGEDCFGMSWPIRAYALEAQGSPDAEARLRSRLVELLARDRRGAPDVGAARRVPVAVAAAARAATEGDTVSAGALAGEVAVRFGVDVQASLAGDAGSLARLFVALGERASRDGDDGLAVVLALNAAWLADAARDPTARDLAMRLHRTSGVDHGAAGGNGSEKAGAIVVLDPADYGSEDGAVVGVRRRAGSRRVLATVLFSSLAPGEHEGRTDAEWIDLMARHDALVRRLITAARGHAIHATGYGFLSLFDGPAAAIDCAAAIVDALRAIGVGARGGLHIGECDLIDDDVTGLAVNIAARVASHAGAGEVLTTEVVRDATTGSGLDFVVRGPHQLKGVPGEWPLFAVTPRSVPSR